jgi:hypothetical protein
MGAKVRVVIAVLLSGFGAAIPASAGTIFSDGTFNLGNYSAGPDFSSSPSQGNVTFAQCPACGDPGSALQFTSASNGTESGTLSLAQALVNTGFSYDPLVQGVITSFSTSALKNISVNLTGTGFGNTYHPVIEQDGTYYVASIPGATFSGPGGPEYQSFSGNLTASSFDNYDFMTGIMGSLNPNFGGDTMLFGLAQISGLTAPNETLITQYDNLSFAINVPEPFTLSLFGAGLAGAVAMRRRKKAKA